MKKLKGILMAFIVGGFFAIVGELIFKVVLAALGPEFPFIGPVTLVGLGLFCGILWICGIQQKIELVGEYGGILHFGSCATAVANVYQQVKKESGSEKAAFKACTFPVIFVCGIGTLAAGLVGIIMALAK